MPSRVAEEAGWESNATRDNLDPVLALLALAAFGVSVVAAFYGMFATMGSASVEKPGSPAALPRRLLYLALGGLGGAVLCLLAGIATAGVF